MSESLRIAQVAPLFESVPPTGYGGTERIVSYLTDELVRQGHDVTLFSVGGSSTDARLIKVREQPLRLDPMVRDWVPHHMVLLERVMACSNSFDVVHFHTDVIQMPVMRRLPVPSLTTLHGRLDLPDLPGFYREFPDANLVSISNHQRTPLPGVEFARTVYHGLPRDLYRQGPGDGGYFVFLGRISPEKRPDHAIEIAKAVGVPLKIAAKVDKADQEYFAEEIEHLLDHPLVEFIGEVDDAGKQDLIGRAKALLFPIDWPEPFGLVMIEAMACGTPVIARRRGSVAEVMKDGVSGAVFETMEEGIEAAKVIGSIDRSMCRAYFDECFTSERMARDYVRAYQELIMPPSQSADDSVRVMPDSRAVRNTA